MRARRGIFVGLIAAFCLLFTLPAGAVTLKDPRLSVDFPEDYIIITRDTVKKNIAYVEHIGHSSDSFLRFMTADSVVLYAATANNADQFQIKVSDSDFSGSVYDLSTLSEADLALTAEALTAQFSGEGALLFADWVTANEVSYYRIATKNGDAQHPYCTVQYITIANGSYYVFAYYNSTAALSDENAALMDRVMGTFRFERRTLSGIDRATSMFQTVLVVTGIVVLAVIAVVIIITFVRDANDSFRRRERVEMTIKRRSRRN